MKWKRKLWLSCWLTILYCMHVVKHLHSQELENFQNCCVLRIVLELVFSNLNNTCNISSTTSSCSPFLILATALSFISQKKNFFNLSSMHYGHSQYNYSENNHSILHDMLYFAFKIIIYVGAVCSSDSLFLLLQTNLCF